MTAVRAEMQLKDMARLDLLAAELNKFRTEVRTKRRKEPRTKVYRWVWSGAPMISRAELIRTATRYALENEEHFKRWMMEGN